MAKLLDHWVEADIITGDQADRIRADAAGPPNPAPERPASPVAAWTEKRVSAGPVAASTEKRVSAGPVAASTEKRVSAGSLVAEAMGYLGGVIVAVGLGLVVGRFWPDLSTVVRVGLTAAVAFLLLVAGAGVTDRFGAAGGRLRSVLWLAASLAYFACLALVAAERFGWSGDRLLLFAAAGGTALSGAVWAVHRRLLQEASTLGFLLMATAGATSMITNSVALTGAAVWAVGVVATVAGALDVVRPARGALVLGAVATIVGSVWVEGETWGTWIAVATVAGMIAYAVLGRDLVLLAVASLGTLVVLPELVVRYFPGVLSAALTLVVVGLLLVVTAVLTARRRPRVRG
jgi:hypothetical protein